MQSIASDAIGGFNAFLAAQRREPGARRKPGSDSTRLTLVLFDDQYEVLFKSIPLTEVPDLSAATLLPRGSTALLDAIGRTLSKMTRSFAARPDATKPGEVIVAIPTDASKTLAANTPNSTSPISSRKSAQ